MGCSETGKRLFQARKSPAVRLALVQPGNGLASHPGGGGRGGMAYGNSPSYPLLLKLELSAMPLFVLFFCLTGTLPHKNVPSSYLTPPALPYSALAYPTLAYPILPSLPCPALSYVTLPTVHYPTPPYHTQPYLTSAYLTCMFPLTQGGSQMRVCTYRRIPLGAQLQHIVASVYITETASPLQLRRQGTSAQTTLSLQGLPNSAGRVLQEVPIEKKQRKTRNAHPLPLRGRRANWEVKRFSANSSRIEFGSGIPWDVDLVSPMFK